MLAESVMFLAKFTLVVRESLVLAESVIVLPKVVAGDIKSSIEIESTIAREYDTV